VSAAERTWTVDEERQVVERLRDGRQRIDTELSKVIVGQKAVIEQALIALFSGGCSSHPT